MMSDNEETLISDNIEDLEFSFEKTDEIKELSFNFESELESLPHIEEFIERLKTIIRRQEKKIKKLYSKLRIHKLQPVTEDAAVQTDVQETKVESKVAESALPGDDNNAWGSEDIAEQVKNVAENALTVSGLVYEPVSGMYYDYKTGYYYNAELRMYYDGHSGKYLTYDETSGKYSYVDEAKENTDKTKGQKRHWVESEDLEEGELSASDENEDQVPVSNQAAVVTSQPLSPSSEVGSAWPPCLRLMVVSSSVAGVGVGTLFLVTCKGGDVGREGKPLVLLPESAVSKFHLKLSFNGENYQAVDIGSRNGTWLNGKRITPALQESEPIDIVHGDELRIGSTTLAVHIHSGTDTCEGCEPGLQQQPAEPAAPLPATQSHRTAMKSLKKRFGLGNFVPPPSASDTHYNDRAERRRVAVGSSHPSEKTETASLSQTIPKKNKGFAMLSKMGWSEGKSLGKHEQGIAEPIALTNNLGATGLGAEAPPSLFIPQTSAAKRKLRVLKITHDRYNQIATVPVTPDTQEDTCNKKDGDTSENQ